MNIKSWKIDKNFNGKLTWLKETKKSEKTFELTFWWMKERKVCEIKSRIDDGKVGSAMLLLQMIYHILPILQQQHLLIRKSRARVVREVRHVPIVWVRFPRDRAWPPKIGAKATKNLKIRPYPRSQSFCHNRSLPTYSI